MEPWFIWRGIDSRTMGVWVSQLPPIIRAAERYDEVTIPGRPGTLILKHGENDHEGYVKECRITVRADADFASLLDWLTGDGDVVFSNEPDRVYRAHLAAEVRFDRDGNSLRVATLPFSVHPHKGQYPPEADITPTRLMRIYNPGTVPAKPLIHIDNNGQSGTFAVYILAHADDAVTDAIVSQDYHGFTDIMVDCDAELITQDGEIFTDAGHEFLFIPPGESFITWGTNIDPTITITPRWRWF